MLPADPAARAGSTPEASGDSSSGTFAEYMRVLITILVLGSLVLPMALSQDYEDYYESFEAKNKTIGSAEFYWLLNRMSSSGDVLGVKMLLSAGADPNGVKDYKGFIEQYPPVEPSWPINQAAWEGHKEVIAALLKAGAKVDNPEGEGLTALLIATMNNHPATVKMLLDAGAKRDYKGPSGTALQIAKEKNFHDVVTLLQKE
jgi:uncharacterized protein